MKLQLSNNQGRRPSSVVRRPHYRHLSIRRNTEYGRRTTIAVFLASLSLCMLTACGQSQSTNWEYMPDMMDSAAIKTYEADLNFAQQRSVRLPMEGTEAQGVVPYAFPKDPVGAGEALKNPLRPTMAVLRRGEEGYMNYCLVCHGKIGAGDGPIIPKFPPPPPLFSEKVSQWPDGRIYHVIMEGQNLMPSYRSQVSEVDRWAIVHYVRVLQRAANPTKADIERLKAMRE